MLRSLRFRLPALFLLGIVLAAVVAALIAVSFFQGYTRSQAAAELRAESSGIVQLYERQAGVGHVSLHTLLLSLGGDRVFWLPAVPGASLLTGPLPQLPPRTIPAAVLAAGSSSSGSWPCPSASGSRSRPRSSRTSRAGSPGRWRRSRRRPTRSRQEHT